MKCFIQNIEKRDIQFVIENITQCGGNCSGCALSSSERMNNESYSLNKLLYNLSLFHQYIESLDSIESVSLFLGQGDHFLLSDIDLEEMVIHICESFKNKNIKDKTVIFLTASAIGKHQDIVRKMDLIYKIAKNYQTTMFIQVVFDPKKYQSHNIDFRKTYLENILYFKKTCGMAELTINIGEDFIAYLSPLDFHQLMIDNQINHVEINWVLNKNTLEMWKKHHLKMYDWLYEFICLNINEHQYEINFLPFLERAFKKMDIEGIDMIHLLGPMLQNHVYLNQNSTYSFGLPGLFSNFTLMKERSNDLIFFKNHQIKLSETETLSKKIYQKMMKNKDCITCSFKNTCIMIGSHQWNHFVGNFDCHWSLQQFLNKIYELNQKNNFNTKFNVNPYTKGISLKNNQDYQYFKNQFLDNK